ncbi:chlororespiratory reduction protein 7 [Vacuolonema iberomarrocanum]|uniref:chlororespiratory reduction protein 7 n=1 Tax=Vacuolonema iberomarrocanum TaxID=3454632 RepID=UPI0019FC0E80|nr:chlororespiratory reduction protein 7 [filamentous cyanobacterium LEGE 07170]
MPDPIMYQEDAYVVLETDQPEVFLSAEELQQKLADILAQRQDNLPYELRRIEGVQNQSKHLMETACELDMDPGQYLQWYAVRLEK